MLGKLYKLPPPLAGGGNPKRAKRVRIGGGVRDNAPLPQILFRSPSKLCPPPAGGGGNVSHGATPLPPAARAGRRDGRRARRRARWDSRRRSKRRRIAAAAGRILSLWR